MRSSGHSRESGDDGSHSSLSLARYRLDGGAASPQLIMMSDLGSIDLPASMETFREVVLDYLSKNNSAKLKFCTAVNDKNQIGLINRILNELNIATPLSINLFASHYLDAIENNKLIETTVLMAYYLINIFLDENGKFRLEVESIRKLISIWLNVDEAVAVKKIETELYSNNDPVLIKQIADIFLNGVIIAITNQFIAIFIDKHLKVSLHSLAEKIANNDYKKYLSGFNSNHEKVSGTFADMPHTLKFSKYMEVLSQLKPIQLNTEFIINQQLIEQHQTRLENTESALEKFISRFKLLFQQGHVLTSEDSSWLAVYQANLQAKLSGLKVSLGSLPSHADLIEAFIECAKPHLDRYDGLIEKATGQFKYQLVDNKASFERSLIFILDLPSRNELGLNAVLEKVVMLDVIYKYDPAKSMDVKVDNEILLFKLRVDSLRANLNAREFPKLLSVINDEVMKKIKLVSPEAELLLVTVSNEFEAWKNIGTIFDLKHQFNIYKSKLEEIPAKVKCQLLKINPVVSVASNPNALYAVKSGDPKGGVISSIKSLFNRANKS